MTDQEMEPGFELVLDNRKLIVAFVVAIAICGLFFVWGYSTGKRQGKIAALNTAAGPAVEEPQVPVNEPGGDDTKAPAVEPEEEQLEWYQSVNKKTNEPAGIEAPESEPPPVEKKEPAVPREAPRAASASVTYSVQLGAFKHKLEADAHAQNIQAKGFDTRVELPTASQPLYLVKVGRFNTRAEAVAVQLRLKKSGFNCFVKTN
jgi:cell division protein FtsN